jgi:hypothetical protein
MNVRAVYDWVTMRDYDLAKERATDEVVERFSRGNTLAQNGSSLEEPELEDMSLQADEAMRELEAYCSVE